MTTDITVLGLNCSPATGGRTAEALRTVLAGAEQLGAATELVEVCSFSDVGDVVARMVQADAFVFGSPMYRASYAHAFKMLLDATPRGLYGTADAPLTARAVAVVATAGSDHHFLGPQAMRNVLVDFFAAHVVSPGLYVAGSGFTEERRLTIEMADLARNQGAALVELARAIEGSAGLRRVTPLA